MTVRGYTRVSSLLQLQGYSLEAQRDRIEAWTRYQNLSPLKVYEERGLSGKRDDRPQLLQLMDDLQHGDTVLVYSLSRLGRGGAVQLLGIVKDIEARGARLVSLTENIDTVTPAGRLLLVILAALTEMEVEIMKERTEAGRTAAALQGIWPHNPKSLPLGWTTDEEGRIVAGPDAALVREIFRLAEGRTPFHHVASELVRRGVPTKHGGTWAATTIQRIVTNPAYHTGGFTYRSTHRPDDPQSWIHLPAPPLLTEAQWQAAQRPYAGNPDRVRPDVYPLTGHLVCGCGTVMNGTRTPNRSQGGFYYYYGCRAKTRKRPVCPVHGRSVVSFRTELLHDRARRALNAALNDPLTLTLLLAPPARNDDPHREERETLERRRADLIDLHLEGLIDREEFRTRRDDLTRRIERLTPAPPQMVLPNDEIVDGYRAAAAMLDGDDYRALLRELAVKFEVVEGGAVQVKSLSLPVLG